MKPAQRWGAIAAAGVLTVAAMAWVQPPDDGPTVLPAPRRAAVAGEPAAAVATSTTLLPLRTRVATAPLADPFAVPGALPAGRALADTALPRTVAAPSAPPLPFIYLGKWSENGRTVVFLQREGQTLTVRGPGPLDADYSVLAIDAQQLTLSYLPLGTQAALRFDAPAPVARAAAVPTSTAPEPDGEPQPGN